ncbi:MAG: hypothetical protein IJ106_05840 [Parasporobacterium sp.]|nr:hypothetical protein [Parasporobacterium sp.]
MKKWIGIILALVMVFSLGITGWAAWEPASKEEEWENVFAEWNEDAPALNYLIEYVEAVTDESSEDYIPAEDRIAVFDMDGTLYGELFPTYLEYYLFAWRILEDPSFEPDEELLELGRELRESVTSHSFAEDIPIRHALGAARAYAGLTLAEFAGFVTERLLQDVDGFEGMTYGEAFYQPMLEVIRTDRLLVKNLKMNKVCQIVQDIGKQPVLSFGNSSGDVRGTGSDGESTKPG